MGLSNLRSEASKKTDLKFEKKLQFYAKVRETVAALNVKKAIGKVKGVKRRRKKLKAYDLSTLSEFLPELKDPRPHLPPPAKFELSCKSRQELVLKEGKQLMAVLNHPAFQSDPLGAIHQHLQCTQPAIEKKPLKNRIQEGKKKKRKKSKSSAPRPMDA
ncbi:hypothetical protein Nepgr_013987 [Nepenthes gracilis]|uniref:Ribosome biogenesis protein slx9-like n=1 Tax=Nepenthes gracilis TaxID=150966 RepID=A0AAD3SKQ6_NEPGR|nr:hypothetical protein Nepgr_013987 [Nepenthes gracilis]